jgi:hypothetical protein
MDNSKIFHQLILSSLKKGQAVKMVVQGRSMKSVLNQGQEVKVVPANFYQVKVGDIVLVEKNKKIMLHWLIFKLKKFGITWGENNLFFDGKIKSFNFLGVLKKQDLSFSRPFFVLKFFRSLGLTVFRTVFRRVYWLVKK